jgi:Caspase domain
VQRAAVLIGVKKTGNLPELQAVSSSVKAMALWAKAQGLDEKLVRVVSDDSGPVTAQRLKDEIESLVDRGTVDQLIVYFSGHGFNIESEYWLLSDAPKDTDAAVNVEGSVRLARYCGIGHVLLVSDCCRSAAEGLQALQVRGSNVFPNVPVSGTERPVDLLFACARGKPSLEVVADPVKAVAEAVKSYSALYSEVLLEYLNGKHDDALDRVKEDGSYVGLLRLGTLADDLKIEVPHRLKAKLGIDPKITQQPDDRIGRSTGNAWVSRVPMSPSRGQASVVPVSRSRPITPFTVSDRLISLSLAGDLGKWNEILGRDLGAQTAVLQRATAAQAVPFGPMHFETGCGFKVRGARVVRTVQRNIGVELLGTEGNVIRVIGTSPGASVLLVLENGFGVVIPALPSFIAGLTFEEGQFMDVSYEPSENSPLWNEYSARAEELRSLRASIAASAALGVFRLDEQGGLALARRMQLAKGVDPSLALYAAYAYDGLQRRDLVDEMRGYMESDLGLTFFDIALLSTRPKTGRILPPFPMLSKGWALLSAYRAELPASLLGIEQRRLPSPWTLFNPAGVEMIERAILSGEIP